MGQGDEGILGTAAGVEGIAALIWALKTSGQSWWKGQGVKCVVCCEAGTANLSRATSSRVFNLGPQQDFTRFGPVFLLCVG